MALPNDLSEEAVAARLHDLLKRARAIKHSTSIDPPLQVSALIREDETLLACAKSEEEARNFIVEGAAKSIFYAQLGSSNIEDPSFVTVWNLLDILQYWGDRNLCSPQLVLILLEELLDSLSIDRCRIALGFLESRREVLIAARSQSKDLVILRLCNELLRRLSRAEDPVFCGRVYILLFRSFPLGDKSSVNLRGNFHTENVTTFEEYLTSTLPSADEMQIDSSGPEGSVKDVTIAADSASDPQDTDNESKKQKPTMSVDELYPVFWSMQQSFSNPPRLFEEENFKSFQSALEATLEKFKEVPKVVQARDYDHSTEAQAQSGDNYDEFGSAFNPKYLTSRDLFKLELSDLAFQRHILVQALILIDFLLTLTEKSKSQPYYQEAQRAMQYGFTLGEQETQWASGIKIAIANYLQDGPDGKSYYRMVDTVLSRDKNWVRWKMENCHSFTRERVPAELLIESKKGAERAVGLKQPHKPRWVATDLQFLTDCDLESGLSELKNKARFTKPSLESYAKRIRTIEENILEGEAEEGKRPLEDKLRSVTWRERRIRCKEKLGSYDKPASTEDKRLKGSDTVPTEPEDRGGGPQQEHPSVEDQRADQQDQVTAETAAAAAE